MIFILLKLESLLLRDIHGLDSTTLLHTVEQYPGLRLLVIDDALATMTDVWSAALVDGLQQQQQQQLRLHTTAVHDLAVARLTALQTLHVTFTAAADAGELMDFVRASPPASALRHLLIRASEQQLGEQLGRELHRFGALQTVAMLGGSPFCGS